MGGPWDSGSPGRGREASPTHVWKPTSESGLHTVAGGVGSALFRSLSDHARALGKTGLLFEVVEDRADALAFLLKRAYTEVG